MIRHSWIAGQAGCIRSRDLTRSFVEEYCSDVPAYLKTMDEWTAVTIGQASEDDDDQHIEGTDTPVTELRKRLDAMYLRAAESLHLDLQDIGRDAAAAWFLSSQFEGSGRWISPPIGQRLAPHLTIRHEEYRQALRSRFLLHPLQDHFRMQPDLSLNCECKTKPPQHDGHQQSSLFAVISQSEPFHYLDCRNRAKQIKSRHDNVLLVLEKFIKARFPTVTLNTEQELPTRPDCDKRVIADLVLKLPPFGTRRMVLDVAIANPAAPSYRNQQNGSIVKPGAANEYRDQFKTAHYSNLTYPDVTKLSPRCYYTFNVEATGRLGASAEQFIKDLYKECQRARELEAAIGPSPIQALARDIGTVIAKYNAQAALFYKRAVSFVPAASQAE